MAPGRSDRTGRLRSHRARESLKSLLVRAEPCWTLTTPIIGSQGIVATDLFPRYTSAHPSQPYLDLIAPSMLGSAVLTGLLLWGLGIWFAFLAIVSIAAQFRDNRVEASKGAAGGGSQKSNGAKRAKGTKGAKAGAEAEANGGGVREEAKKEGAKTTIFNMGWWAFTLSIFHHIFHHIYTSMGSRKLTLSSLAGSRSDRSRS